MEEILNWGIEVIKAVQTTTCTPLTWIAMFIHHVFNSAFYVVVIGIFYWGIDTKKGAKLGSALLFSTCVNVAIKNFFQVPRPYIFDPTVSTNATETSFAFPSGHSQAAATFFPLFAGLQRSWKKWLKVLVGVCIPIIVALSRMYLGVHYPTDVIVGLALGFLISCGVLLFWDNIAVYVKPVRKSLKILVIALICFCLNAIPRIDTSSTALFFGFTVGHIFITEKNSFSAKSGTTLQKVLRIFLGFVIIAAIYLGLKIIFPGNESDLYQLFRFLRYGIIGFSGTYLVPKLFVALKLASPVSKSEDILDQ
jgi:membrane-associated phospholipid phosphatase